MTTGFMQRFQGKTKQALGYFDQLVVTTFTTAGDQAVGGNQTVTGNGTITGNLVVTGTSKLGTAGTVFHGLLTITAALTPASVGATTAAAQAVTVAGIAAGDLILAVVKPTEQAGLAVAGARVTGANTVSLNFVNPTVASITPTAAETYTFIVLRP